MPKETPEGTPLKKERHATGNVLKIYKRNVTANILTPLDEFK